MIVPNGYNIGRDLLVQSAVSGSSWKGISWMTDVEWREGLLEPGFKGIDRACVDILPVVYPHSPCRNQPCHRARWPRRDPNGPPCLTGHLTCFVHFEHPSQIFWVIELTVYTVGHFLYLSICHPPIPRRCIYLVGYPVFVRFLCHYLCIYDTCATLLIARVWRGDYRPLPLHVSSSESLAMQLPSLAGPSVCVYSLRVARPGTSPASLHPLLVQQISISVSSTDRKYNNCIG